MGDGPNPFAGLIRIGQLAVDQEISHLQETASLRQFLDWVTPVAQNAALAIDVGDGAAAAGGVEECWVVAHHAGPGPVRRDLLEFGGRDRAVPNGNLVAAAGAIIDDGKRLLRHWLPPEFSRAGERRSPRPQAMASFHSRIYQRLTTPLRTNGSPFTNSSAHRAS